MNKALVFALCIITLAVILAFGVKSPILDYTQDIEASGSLSLYNVSPVFICSGVNATYNTHTYFVLARHCVVDDEQQIRKELMVSFSNNIRGPYYFATVKAVSDTDDLAVLTLINGENLPSVELGNELPLNIGHKIFGLGFPLGRGKRLTGGWFFSHRFVNVHELPSGWDYSMPVLLPVAPGSSGGGIFDSANGKLIGITVGYIPPNIISIAIPVSRLKIFLDKINP